VFVPSPVVTGQHPCSVGPESLSGLRPHELPWCSFFRIYLCGHADWNWQGFPRCFYRESRGLKFKNYQRLYKWKLFAQNAKTFRRRQPWTKFSGPWGAGLWQGVGTWVAHEVAAGWLFALGSRPWSYHLEAYFLQSPLSSDSPDWWKIPVEEFEVNFSKRECKLPLQMRLGCPAVLFDSSKLKVRPWITVECLRIQAWHWHPSRHPLISVFSMKRSEKILKEFQRYEKMKK